MLERLEKDLDDLISYVETGCEYGKNAETEKEKFLLHRVKRIRLKLKTIKTKYVK